MKVMFSQSYIKVDRRIENNQQLYIKLKAHINLYEDRIETDGQSFILKDVFDVSFKSISLNNGFLYLHTNQGIFAYIVESNPSIFINMFKSIKTKYT